ncbi:hypothetical protein L873DRAFT_1804636 [Choiromyces venosus 120613-1]|uniref:Uncharacterized protein n=1 Tax=Choiromyces venosus 120613-1 TaxID=1336337 RepID=A0A3N4JV17_9PEZI|nr:hypothetical protein L873DRAFT_1804636 [Choiromyces venosus 120613-1]
MGGWEGEEIVACLPITTGIQSLPPLLFFMPAKQQKKRGMERLIERLNDGNETTISVEAFEPVCRQRIRIVTVNTAWDQHSTTGSFWKVGGGNFELELHTESQANPFGIGVTVFLPQPPASSQRPLKANEKGRRRRQLERK